MAFGVGWRLFSVTRLAGNSIKVGVMFNIAKFFLRFPEFAEADTDLVELLAEDAQAVIGTDPNRWCGVYDAALAYLVAHFLHYRTTTLAVAAAGGAASNKSGPITATSAHGVSVTYATPGGTYTKDEAFYMKTPYGEQFLMYRQQCFGVSVMVAASAAPGCSSCNRVGFIPSLGVRLWGGGS